MNLSEAAKLLALCAAFDQRTVGETDVAAWQETLERISFEDAKDAVKFWYREHRERIMPADVVKHVRQARTDRAMRAALPAVAPATEDRRRGHLAAIREDIARIAAQRKAPAGEPEPSEGVPS